MRHFWLACPSNTGCNLQWRYDSNRVSTWIPNSSSKRKLLTRQQYISCSAFQAGAGSRRGTQGMARPLPSAATPSRRLPETPDLLKFIWQAAACAHADGVGEACCRMTTAALRRLAACPHAAAEHDIYCCRVNNQRLLKACITIDCLSID